MDYAIATPVPSSLAPVDSVIETTAEIVTSLTAIDRPQSLPEDLTSSEPDATQNLGQFSSVPLDSGKFNAYIEH